LAGKTQTKNKHAKVSLFFVQSIAKKMHGQFSSASRGLQLG
jgi:hypothetical protein